MAENELLDVGNLRRWRLTRAALADPLRSFDDVASCAASEFDKVQRQIASSLRKGDVFLLLMKAAKGSRTEQQAIVASLKERQLANTVLQAIKLSGTDDPSAVAATTARSCVQRVIEQILLRSGRQTSYRTPEAKAALADSLKAHFAASERNLRATLEASLRGERIKRIPRIPAAPRPRLDAKSLVNLSLNPSISESPHAP